MNISIILYELQKYDPCFSDKQKGGDLHRTRLFSKQTDRESSRDELKDTLLIAEEDDLLLLQETEGVQAVLCITSKPETEEHFSGFPFDVIAIAAPKELSPGIFCLQIFNDVNVILQDFERYEICSDIIFRSNLLLNKKKYNIDEVADVIYYSPF